MAFLRFLDLARATWIKGFTVMLKAALGTVAGAILLFVPLVITAELSGFELPSERVLLVVAVVVLFPYWIGRIQQEERVSRFLSERFEAPDQKDT